MRGRAAWRGWKIGLAAANQRVCLTAGLECECAAKVLRGQGRVGRPPQGWLRVPYKTAWSASVRCGWTGKWPHAAVLGASALAARQREVVERGEA